MKTKRRVISLALAAILLVCATVFGTLAYLTSTDSVTNTFTVGDVKITLDEAKVNELGVVDEGEERVEENAYKLLPGHTYVKDPTVHVEAGSEDAYLFVKVENGIAAIEGAVSNEQLTGQTASANIAGQIAANGWQALTGVTDVYYREYTGQAAEDYVVFEAFNISGTVNNTTLAGYEEAKIVITAYAIQKDGFNSAAEAWTAGAFTE